ncbi:uncharacterized protein [Periplaneta americana]|uniref:uncharacterized protein isoform X3 n=1 Tax=Periplaneta americana TaxID=6978 RepID=UPI0037E95A04
MMDVFKMEREIGSLAIGRSNNTDVSKEEEKPLSEKGNILDLQVTGINTECMDHTYAIKNEMAFGKTPVPIDFMVMKSGAEEENELDLHMTEIKLECIDKSYDLKSEITFDETPVPIDYPIMKNEVEAEEREINKVEEEFKLEVTAEEDEVLTERWSNQFADLMTLIIEKG